MASAGAADRFAGHTKLHLGCGPHVMEGWANLDLEAGEGAIAFDLTRPLPLADGAITHVYSEHFLEHLTREQGLALMRECHRVLVPGGVLRVSTPDLAKMVMEYLMSRTTEWRDMEWNPATPCQMMNEGMRLWGHQFLYDEKELRAMLVEAGFEAAQRLAWRQSGRAELRGLETRPYHGEIILEAVK
ncbi:MAG: methyltransferase domain-containing protein [Candidatus Eisenbacteria bacterium]|nr:methyltransferase domain-containing protein [Candidatus Eisenbacteria bacterium]